jgi:hypothetical protein
MANLRRFWVRSWPEDDNDGALIVGENHDENESTLSKDGSLG